jgi:hypothetical protein
MAIHAHQLGSSNQGWLLTPTVSCVWYQEHSIPNTAPTRHPRSVSRASEVERSETELERHARGQSRARPSNKSPRLPQHERSQWSATRAVNPARDIQERRSVSRDTSEASGAGDGLRTRYLDLGKVALYQVSYSRSARGSILPADAGPANRPPARHRPTAPPIPQCIHAHRRLVESPSVQAS